MSLSSLSPPAAACAHYILVRGGIRCDWRAFLRRRLRLCSGAEGWALLRRSPGLCSNKCNWRDLLHYPIWLQASCWVNKEKGRLGWNHTARVALWSWSLQPCLCRCACQSLSGTAFEGLLLTGSDSSSQLCCGELIWQVLFPVVGKLGSSWSIRFPTTLLVSKCPTFMTSPEELEMTYQAVLTKNGTRGVCSLRSWVMH